ncbi:MAG: phosphoribosyltransferase [Candidatus Micrarchaeota archaeon]
MDLLRINWDVAIKYCEQLASMIKHKPDVIIGISRGGLVPARILSDILAVKEIKIIGASFYTNIEKTKDTLSITQHISEELNDKSVLIVDDVADSGKSLKEVYDYIIKKGAKKIKTATLHYKPKSIFKPDYYVMITDAWIVYPWEVHETERELSKN